MASISLPPPSQPTIFSQHYDTVDHPFRGHSRRPLSMSSPLPNPPFVFPARDPEDADVRPSATPEPQSRTRPPLPAFSFNPGAAHAPQPSTLSPQGNRPGGHRRQYSEFVGGDKLVGPEPTGDEKPTPTPANLPPPGPGVGGHRKRTHAHRRSGAVASVDLSAISREFGSKPSPDSAPGTPADKKREHDHDTMRPMSQSAASLGRPTPPASPLMAAGWKFPGTEQRTDNTPVVEPPLPTNTSDATPVPPPDQAEDSARDSGPSTSYNAPVEDSPIPRARPKTADASFAFGQGGTSMTDEIPRRKRPISEAYHSRSHKSLSSGVLELALRKMKQGGDLDDDASITSMDDRHDSCESSPSAKEKEKSKKKRQKKVRSWAGALLTRRKGKPHQSKTDTTEESSSKPTPIITRTNSDLGSNLDVDFDDDNVVVIRSPTSPNEPEYSEATPDTPTTPTLENSWKPRSFYEQGKEEDTRSPIIDLDAALGPFNTPDMRPGLAGSNFSAATKRMYSGGRRGEFIGPEMRFHRRAESAPEMPPFDRSFIPGGRFGSNSGIESADVFYEEEEDAFLAASGQSIEDVSRPSNTNADSNDGNSATSKDSSHTVTRDAAGDDDLPNAGLGIRRDAPTEPSLPESPHGHGRRVYKKQNAVEQLQQARNPFSQPRSPVEVIKQEDWSHKAPAPVSPDISPRFLPADKRPTTSPMDLGPHIPQFSLHDAPSIPTSTFPSPDFNASSDASRSITTPSTSDRKFSGPPYNMGQDYHYASAEDVPSLSSSASTASRMQRFSASFLPRTRFSTDRSASFSAMADRRQSNSIKRSSFASLSKLGVGPRAERSKLCHEEKPPGDAPEKAKKKGHRISRLKHLWKTKDKGKSNDHVPKSSI